MIEVDGYKAFHGTLRVTPVNGNEPYTLTGDCLYEPEHDCWYVQVPGMWCQSIPADICEVVEDDTVPVVHGRWGWRENGGPYYYNCVCSVCGRANDFQSNYCPSCGAKMTKMDKDATDGA